IRHLFAPVLHDYTSPLILDDGKIYRIDDDPIWTKPFGKRLCIVDVDTRSMNKTNEPWNTAGAFNWHNIETSAGVLNHYLYSKIHGYDYKFIHTTPYPDRDTPWSRIPALSSLLKEYDLVVSVDIDVIFPQLHIPYEWLLNIWGVTADTAIALPTEPFMKGWNGSKDRKGRRNDNAGFMTLQKVPRVQEMLKKWVDCPVKRKACAHFKHRWPAEQGAFNEFIRYEYWDIIREIPCDDALGYPGMNSNCHGRLVSHYTLAKKHVKEAAQTALAYGVMQQLQLDLQSRTSELKIERLKFGLDAEPEPTS
ncbi:hypothetical protein NA57DRAFT_42756, partial [Rhizodiscina lignyota]